MYSKFPTIIAAVCAVALAACSAKEVTPERRIDAIPSIFPDYTGVTVPPNLVAPRFWIPDSCGVQKAQAVFSAGNLRVPVDASGRCVAVPVKTWRDLIAASDTVTVTLCVKKDGVWSAYRPFEIYVAQEEIDPYIAYRLIEPGYESWNEMGIYYRCLEDYTQKAAITNRSTDYGCMNCHSMCEYDPDRMLLHLRVEHGGTYIVDKGEVSRVDTESLPGITSLVYPSWHPSGRYVAFSTNKTKQMFHTSDPNRIEVYDNASDVVVYDTEAHRLIDAPHLADAASLETFPYFSADGRRLYFCSADSVPMPDCYRDMKYSVCAVDFDPQSGRVGETVDTVYDTRADGRSASFPRPSRDGKRLMFTLSPYGTFSIWHRDADLYMADLETGEIKPLDILNSDETESYHSWSSNGRWVVYSSRRLDGLYTRPMLAYVDADGNPRKPLLLPPETEDYYLMLMKSYNVPEFAKAPLPAIKINY